MVSAIDFMKIGQGFRYRLAIQFKACLWIFEEFYC